MTTLSIDRFRTAQAATQSGLATAVAELVAGRKQSHWIWYVFPQLAGLGFSDTAKFYGLKLPEAEMYWADPELRSGYLRALRAVHRHVVNEGRKVGFVLGSAVDAQKLVSSLTLFAAVARRPNAVAPPAERAELFALAESLLARAKDEGLSRCSFTEEHLNRSGWAEVRRL